MYRIPSPPATNLGKRWSQISDSLFSSVIANPIRIGLFYNDVLLWKYPNTTECKEKSPTLSIMSLNCSADDEIIKFRLSTDHETEQLVKVVVQYNHLNVQCSTAFYSPNENAIVSFTDDGQCVTMIGGFLDGKTMKQYCIHDKEEYNHVSLQGCLRHGRLPMSWLANGDVCSTFILETVISAKNEAEGVIWTFHSNSEESVKFKKKEMIARLV